MNQKETIITQLKEQLDRAEELRLQRAEMQQRHAKEIGVIDLELQTKAYPKISALASMLS